MEGTNPRSLTSNAGHGFPMTSKRTPLPSATAAAHETASATGASSLNSSQSTIPIPSLIPVGDGDFLSLSPLGVIMGDQAVFMSSSAEPPPSPPVTGIGSLSSVAPVLPLQTSRASIKSVPPEAPSNAAVSDAEIPTRPFEPVSNVATDPESCKTAAADLSNGYNTCETQVVYESPVSPDAVRSGIDNETHPIDDEGCDDMLTAPLISVENKIEPHSQLDMKIPSDSDKAANGQDADIEQHKNGSPSSGGEAKIKDEALGTAEPQADPSQTGSLDDKKKGDEFMPAGNFGTPIADKREVSSEPDVQAIIGSKVAKKFGRKLFKGEVVSYDTGNQWYKVVYEDGDEEDLEMIEVKEILLAAVEDASDALLRKRKSPNSKRGSKKQARKTKAKSQDIEMPRARPKRKGLNSQKAISLQEQKQESSKQKFLPSKSASTGGEKQAQSKRQRGPNLDIAQQVKTVNKTQKAERSSPKEPVKTATKNPLNKKGARH